MEPKTAEKFREKYADKLAAEDVVGLVGVADETYPAMKALRKDNAKRKARGE